MRKYVFIGLGGFLGAISRYSIESMHLYRYRESLPLGTLLINITGSFMLALVLTVALEVRGFDADVRLGITTGFLGAYTTFSTLCKETVGLISQGDYLPAVSYIAASTVLGLAAAYLGAALAHGAVSRLVKKDKGELQENAAEEIEGGVE